MTTTHEWEQGRVRLFVSHRHHDASYLGEVKIELVQYGIDAFLAHDDLRPNVLWLEEIQGALQTCHLLAAYLTDGFGDSEWTDQEVGFAFGRGIPVIAIMAGAAPHGFLSPRQGVNAKTLSPGALAYRIFAWVDDHAETTTLVAPALVQAFVDARSWTEASSISKLVQMHAARLTEADADRLELALESNDQCSGAYYVPERVALIAASVRSRVKA